MQGREKKTYKKREEEEDVVKNELEELTEDSQNMQQENNTSMVFAKRSVQPWKAEDDKLKEDLKEVVGGR